MCSSDLRVVDRKVSRGQVFLVTDGGLHHHLAASGNFGQVIRKNYPVAIGNRMADGERETLSVVGPLCTPLDLLADQMELPAADVGDTVPPSVSTDQFKSVVRTNNVVESTFVPSPQNGHEP